MNMIPGYTSSVRMLSILNPYILIICAATGNCVPDLQVTTTTMHYAHVLGQDGGAEAPLV
jgi:hypothetical protein